MSLDNWLHIAEIIIIGLPAWYGATKFFFILREYPPHLHNEGDKLSLKFPKGFEPTHYRKEGIQ